MATKTKQWSTGTGSATIQYTGQGDGQITITSDPNSVYEARSMQITVETTDGSGISRTVTINQAAKHRIDISAAVVTASNQTYSGSALTPAPTVTLNGETIPSTEYDVAYSNNTNAGTATITVTGKGDYTGTATGTFTINKATPSYTAPAARTNLTYTGSNLYLTTTGSSNDGTIKYSLDGVNWYTTRRQGSTAGTYISYWKLEGDSNHTDINSTSISTTIAKASRTLSFADTYMVLNTSSTGTKTATPSAGSGDGAITYSIANTTYATINSSTGAVTSKTSDGSVTVTSTIAEGTNYLSASATYTLYVFATTHNYSYNGSYRSVTLPPGTYQFQCWGAQGGSNGTNSTYGITAKAGGKGGYSVGQLTVLQATGVRVYVGGQGSSSAGGYNGGGSTTGTSQYNSGNFFGYSKMGGGGGASDIRLSDGALLSRMIVAGGGGGGAMSYQEVATERTVTETPSWYISPSASAEAKSRYSISIGSGSIEVTKNAGASGVNGVIDLSSYNFPVTVSFTYSMQGGADGSFGLWYTPDADLYQYTSGGLAVAMSGSGTVSYTFTDPSKPYIGFYCNDMNIGTSISITDTSVTYTEPYTYTHVEGSIGGFGGGIESGSITWNCKANQTSAGNSGGFGYGAEQDATSYRFASGAGGGGWYGGGRLRSDTSQDYTSYSGGGSGWVNTSASSGNRPSGYTGLELDSGATYAGNTSFPAPGGGNETGHSGDGYIRITRIS